MNILIVTPYYPPDQGPIPMMYSALCNDLAQKGANVTVIAAQPFYGEHTRFQRKFPLTETQEAENVRIVRVYVPKFKKSFLPGRLVTLAFYNLLAACHILTKKKKDAALVVNHAMEIFIPLLTLHFFKRTPIHYRIHDIFPDVGVRLGVFKNPVVIRILDWAESVCYRSARNISVVNEGFINLLLGKKVPRQKLEVITDWEDTEKIYPTTKGNPFAVANGYQDKFLIMYGGNLGFSQGLEELIHAAVRLKDYPDILFAFIGEGVMKAKLQQMTHEMRLDNVRFHPYQPHDKLHEVYGAADVGFVSLIPGISPEWCPAKIYTLMASGTPIVAAVDRGGDAERTITKSMCGFCIPHGDTDGLVDAIMKLYLDSSLRQTYSQNARAYVEQYSSRKACTSKLQDALRRICL